VPEQQGATLIVSSATQRSEPIVNTKLPLKPISATAANIVFEFEEGEKSDVDMFNVYQFMARSRSTSSWIPNPVPQNVQFWRKPTRSDPKRKKDDSSTKALSANDQFSNKRKALIEQVQEMKQQVTATRKKKSVGVSQQSEASNSTDKRVPEDCTTSAVTVLAQSYESAESAGKELPNYSTVDTSLNAHQYSLSTIGIDSGDMKRTEVIPHAANPRAVQSGEDSSSAIASSFAASASASRTQTGSSTRLTKPSSTSDAPADTDTATALRTVNKTKEVQAGEEVRPSVSVAQPRALDRSEELAQLRKREEALRAQMRLRQLKKEVEEYEVLLRDARTKVSPTSCRLSVFCSVIFTCAAVVEGSRAVRRIVYGER
jgi:hypothetical protein